MVRDQMPYHNPAIFKKSLLAVAVLTLSGCASAPKMDDVDLSPIGAGILVAGRATAEVGVYAWDVSKYMLGFSDDAGERDDSEPTKTSDIQFPLDEIDEALLKEDAYLPEDALNPVEIANATANYDLVFETPSAQELMAFNDSTQAGPAFQAQAEEQDVQPVAIEDTELLPVDTVPAQAQAPGIDDSTADEPDYIHTVADNENLWDIAKKTTGDATNWHVLADVNDLNQDAGIFVGQSLVIPADMLKPGYPDTPNDNDTSNDNANVARNTSSNPTQTVSLESTSADKQTLTAASESNPGRLEIPTADKTTGTAMELQAGETLWNFAKRTTGDATNWKAIANHNDFTEKQAVVVRAGQRIFVPEDLMKSDANIASAKPPLSDEARAEVLAAIEKVNQSAINASSELLNDASSLSNAQLFDDETQPITIVEANFQTDPSQQPIKIESDAKEVVKMTQSTDLNEVMISGTYYPKAIYNDADFSSSLLMRVSPGTSLKVSKALGSWLEVETDKGKGYVHKRDIK